MYLGYIELYLSELNITKPSIYSGCYSSIAVNFECKQVQRFVPSEYGCDVEHAGQMLEPARSILGAKCRVREALKDAGIPHTIISSNWIQSFLLPRAGDPEANGPPETRVRILGDGTTQGIYGSLTNLVVSCIMTAILLIRHYLLYSTILSNHSPSDFQCTL